MKKSIKKNTFIFLLLLLISIKLEAVQVTPCSESEEIQIILKMKEDPKWTHLLDGYNVLSVYEQKQMFKKLNMILTQTEVRREIKIFYCVYDLKDYCLRELAPQTPLNPLYYEEFAQDYATLAFSSNDLPLRLVIRRLFIDFTDHDL